MKLNERYVVVDIETTGHAVTNGDRIIQVGVVIIDEGEIVNTYTSLVNPNRDIPPFIEDLTGITNDCVKKAPHFQEIIPTLLSLFENSSFVAHNVEFDFTFLTEQLEMEGYLFPSIPLYDTVELSRILMPEQESYKLTQLAEYLGFSHDRPHQADSDAEVTAYLFLNLLQRLKELPLLTLQQLVPISRHFNSDLEPLLHHCIQQKIEQGVDDGQSFDCYRQIALKRFEEQKNPEELSQKSQDFNQLIDTLYDGGKLQKALKNFEVRHGQQQMMKEINEAFHLYEHKLIEAGTGTGKSLAYLVASAFFAEENKKPVVISTQTIPLQEQLFIRDLPILEQILPFQIKVALLKGRNNYLCLRKFEKSIQTFDNDSYDILLTKAIILIWLTKTETGDIEELNLPSGGRNFWYDVQSDAQSDLGPYSPWFSRCFYHRARKRAEDAHLIITNHALLCMDMILDQRIIPTYSHAVIDEAHHLEETASNHLGASTSYVTFSFLFQRLGTPQERGMIEYLFSLIKKYAEKERKTKDILYDLLVVLKEETDELFRMLHSYVMQKSKKSATDVGRVRYRYTLEEGDLWQAILECSMRIHNQMKEVIRLLNIELEMISFYKENMPYDDRGALSDIERVIQSIQEQEQLLFELLLEYDPEAVYWIEIEPKGAKNATFIYKKPVDVSDLLADHFFMKKKSVILTSATLSVNGNFDYQEKQLGLIDFGVKKCIIPSPFSYEKQVRLLIPTDLPNIKDVTEKEFATEIAIKLWRMSEVSSGKILVLFTAYEMLRQVYRNIQDFNEQGMLQLIGQGITSGSRTRLTKMFKESEKAILFGTSSFWEGIDLPGDELQTVVIVRLPFSPPDQPLLQAQLEKVKENGGNPFMDISLPQAIIRFKQGFGRLIRTTNDRGSVFVFDRRITTTRYGKLFLRSLPNTPVHEGKLETLLEEFSEFI